MKRFVGVILCAVLSGCNCGDTTSGGGGGGTGGNGGSGAGGGTGTGGGSGGGSGDAGTTVVTLTGARTSTVAGIAPDVVYTPSVNRAEVAFHAGNAIEAVAFDFMFDGQPMLQTYVGDSDAGISCNVYDTLDGGLDGWLADRGTGIGDPGACSVTLSALNQTVTTGTQYRWDAHGTVNATLPARSGSATGTITFSASF